MQTFSIKGLTIGMRYANLGTSERETDMRPYIIPVAVALAAAFVAYLAIHGAICLLS